MTHQVEVGDFMLKGNPEGLVELQTQLIESNRLANRVEQLERALWSVVNLQSSTIGDPTMLEMKLRRLTFNQLKPLLK